MSDLSYVTQAHLGLVSVSGGDARRFLHAQTSQDIADLPPSRWTTAAWLSAKGRVRALFDVVPYGDDDFWLVTPADNVPFLATELGRFVLRADVRLTPVDALGVVALAGRPDAWLDSRQIELSPPGIAVADGLTLVSIARDRIDLIGDAEALARASAGLEPTTADTVARHAIAAGRPEVPALLRERYTAHMLSLDLIEAVSFTKGCYPGQEIVARTQNLGRSRRRLRRFFVAGGPRPEPGSAILAEGQEIGEVNRTAATTDGYELLAVAERRQADESLALPDGRALTALPLPNDPEPVT